MAAGIALPPMHEPEGPAGVPEATHQAPTRGRLIVKVQPILTGRYLLRAWFEEGGTTRVVETEDQHVDLAGIPERFRALMTWCGVNLRSRIVDARIEVFLPLELLSTTVDRWPLGPEHRPVGSRYSVVVRSYERAYEEASRAEVLPFWEDRANRLPGPGQPVEENQIIWADDAGPYELEDSTGPVICAASTLARGAVGASGDVDVVQEIVNGGYPFAVWARRREPPCPGLQERLKQLVLDRPLDEIAQNILAARRDGYRSGSDDHWGRQLTVLWDPPADRPPDCRYSYAQPELLRSE
jgi:hypothetical protein